MAEELVFPLGGSVALVGVLGGSPGLARRTMGRLVGLERDWNGSDGAIARLNAAAGAWTTVSADTYRLVDLALRAREVTGGAYDPMTPSGGEVEVSSTHRCVRLADRVTLDPRALWAGAAADLAADELVAAGAQGVCVRIGTVTRVAGTSPSGRGWPIPVELPGEHAATVVLRLGDGAVASVVPSRPAPSSSAAAATVVSHRAWSAQVLATLALEAGSVAIGPVLACGATGWVLTGDGITLSGDAISGLLAAGSRLGPRDRPTGSSR